MGITIGEKTPAPLAIEVSTSTPPDVIIGGSFSQKGAFENDLDLALAKKAVTAAQAGNIPIYADFQFLSAVRRFLPVGSEEASGVTLVEINRNSKGPCFDPIAFLRDAHDVMGTEGYSSAIIIAQAREANKLRKLADKAGILHCEVSPDLPDEFDRDAANYWRRTKARWMLHDIFDHVRGLYY